MALSVIALVSYLIGSVPFAFIVNKFFFKQDPRQTGSKNIGALNTLRIGKQKKGTLVGILAFLIVFFLDAFKGVFAILLTQKFLALPEYQPDLPIILGTVAFFVVLGHNYSAYLGFKGGRGAATLFGIALFLNWQMACLWVIATFLPILVGEIFAGHKWNKKLIMDAVNNQIIGRLCGEILGLCLIYCLNRDLFGIVALPLLLVLIAHKDRLKEQIKNIKNKSYLN